MKIRAHQTAAFQEAAERLFVLEVADLLRKHHPETLVGLSDEEIERRVARAIASARGYGMTQRAALGAFVAVAFQVSPCFDRHPLIRAILTDELLPPDTRVDVLVGCLPSQYWEEAAHLDEASAASEIPVAGPSRTGA